MNKPEPDEFDERLGAIMDDINNLIASIAFTEGAEKILMRKIFEEEGD